MVTMIFWLILIKQNLIVDNNHKMQDKLELVLCPGYEHMDTLWGENVYQDVFKPVLERLENWNFFWL